MTKIKTSRTLEDCKIDALNHVSKISWKRNSPHIYNYAGKNGWTKECCSHMVRPIVHNKKWTKDVCIIDAKNYTTKMGWFMGSQSAFAAAAKFGWLEECCSHMEVLRNSYSFDFCKETALKYATKTHFKENEESVFYYSERRGWLAGICSHMPYRVDTSGEKNHKFKWPNSRIRSEASRFTTRSQFERECPVGYTLALKRKIIDEVCSHMDDQLIYWTFDMINIAASKHNCRVDFKECNPKAYQAAQRMGVLDTVCSHMRMSRGSSRAENILFSKIKEIYPTTSKLRDRKAKIKNKLYIKGFDIDIFIEEFCKGIEFDGDYHHSFDMMRKSKSRSKWSDDDIRNYHQIKDDYFLSKGIKILHIQEKDWKEDQQKCIDRCLEFLSTSNKPQS